MKETSEATKSRLKEFNSQSLANVILVIATVGHATPGLLQLLADITMYLDAIAEVTTSRSKHFNSQDLLRAIEVITTVGYASPEHFDSITEVATHCLTDFNSQSLANIVWAFAGVGRASPILCDAITEVAIHCLTHSFLKDWRTQCGPLPTSFSFDTIAEAAKAISLLCAVDATPVAQYLAQASLPDYIMAMTAFVGSGSRIFFPTPGKAWMVWTFSTELLAYTAVSLTCAVGDTPGAQYLAQALIANCIMAMTASIGIGTRIGFRHLERLVWFGPSAAVKGGRYQFSKPCEHSLGLR